MTYEQLVEFLSSVMEKACKFALLDKDINGASEDSGELIAELN